MMNFREAVNGGNGCSNIRKDRNSGFRGSSRHDSLLVNAVVLIACMLQNVLKLCGEKINTLLILSCFGFYMQ